MIVGDSATRRAGDPAGPMGATAAAGLADAVRRASGAFGALEERLAEVGGVAPVVALYDRIREEMDRVEYAELDRVAADIRGAIDALLRMDAAVRKLSNLKLVFEREARAAAGADGG